MTNYGLEITAQGLRLTLPYFELAANTQALAVIAGVFAIRMIIKRVKS